MTELILQKKQSVSFFREDCEPILDQDGMLVKPGNIVNNE